MLEIKKFELGLVVTTIGIHAEIQDNEKFGAEIFRALARYTNGDWGEIPKEDKATNEEAIRDEFRVFAGYKTSKGKIWIITEADRSVTTILFPKEY